MKEFMLLFKGPYYEDLPLSPQKAQEQMEKWFAWIEELKKQGSYIDGRPLVKTGKIVSGRQMIKDGPFVESKELVGGYFILKVNTMDEAIEAANGFPDFELGGIVEIREILDLSQVT